MFHVSMRVSSNMNRQVLRTLRLALPGLLLGLTACTTVGPDHSTPDSVIEAHWLATDDPSFQAGTRKFIEITVGKYQNLFAG